MAIVKYKGVGPLAVGALCVAILTACGSNTSSAKSQTGGEATDATSPSAVATTGAAGGTSAASATSANSSSTNLPIYPGAAKQAMPAGFHAATTHCGRKIAVVSMYKVGADAQDVADWYKGRMQGASVLNTLADSGSSPADDTNIMILDANGDAGVDIMQMHFSSPVLAKASKSIGADKTSIGMETFDPPMGADYVALMQQATGSDAAAKQAAEDKLKSMCGSDS